MVRGMNTNPNAIRILCYGDSNTWGRSGKNTDRYPINIRWTGILQQLLGDTYEVIEEGLRSRTTDLDDNDPQFPGRNGLSYLVPCLESHNPIDIVLLMLGTNDFKTKFDRSPKEISLGVEKLIQAISKYTTSSVGEASKILLLSPPHIKEAYLSADTFFKGSGEKSVMLGDHLKVIANTYNCLFINTADFVEAGEFDGVHLEPDQHQKLALVIKNTIMNQE